MSENEKGKDEEEVFEMEEFDDREGETEKQPMSKGTMIFIGIVIILAIIAMIMVFGGSGIN